MKYKQLTWKEVPWPNLGIKWVCNEFEDLNVIIKYNGSELMNIAVF